MTAIRTDQFTTQIDGSFVVFLIGMRINSWWRVHQWLPVMRAMRRMLKEIDAHPEFGCLGYSAAGLTIIQYWRSFDHLEAYARSPEHQHWPAWLAFNRRMAKSRGTVGIWHETYLVADGQYEAAYSGMPLHGLAKAGHVSTVGEHNNSARLRLGKPSTPRQTAET